MRVVRQSESVHLKVLHFRLLSHFIKAEYQEEVIHLSQLTDSRVGQYFENHLVLLLYHLWVQAQNYICVRNEFILQMGN